MPHWDLGRYGFYILGAWGLSIVVLGALVVDTLARARRWKREVEAREADPAP